MNLQTLTVIFIIIIMPITLVMSAYIQTHIDTINSQTGYDMKLYSATYDSIKAFQLNTINNDYATIADSRRRDVEAAVQTFMTSIATSLRTWWI